MKSIKIYTDGACSGNPGVGGWGAILLYNGHEKAVSGATPYTTNNRMELAAVIEALKLVKEPCLITVYSDSAYVCNAFVKRWVDNWQANGWKTASKKDVENIDLWQALLTLMQPHKVRYEKVPGHADNAYNNRCDQLARAASQKLAKKPDNGQS